MQLPKLNMPQYPVKLKRKNNEVYCVCTIRQKDILLTPEEWVRQQFIGYLITEKGYPKNLLAVEKQVKVNGMNKRFDILAFNTEGKPIVLVECKAHTVALSQAVFSQAANYNMTLQVPYLIITNGLQHIQTSINFTESTAKIEDEVIVYGEL